MELFLWRKNLIMEEVNEKVKQNRPNITGWCKSCVNKIKKANKKMVLMLIGLIILVLVLLIGSFGMWAYNHATDLGPVSFVPKVIPYPAMIVDGSFIRLSDWQNEYSGWKLAIASQGDQVDDSQLRQDVSEKMKYDILLEKLARKYKVKITDEMIEAEIAYIVENNFESREEFLTDMPEMFGWDEKTFIKHVVYPSVLAREVNAKFMADPEIWKVADEKLPIVQARLAAGEVFEDLAMEVSDDTYTAPEGGDLGWFSRGEMIQEFEDAAFALEPGEVSEAIKTVYGYHFIKLDDKKVVTNEEGVEEVEQVSAKHILIQPKQFQTYLEDLMIDLNVINLIKM